jgi:hypothetical protein
MIGVAAAIDHSDTPPPLIRPLLHCARPLPPSHSSAVAPLGQAGPRGERSRAQCPPLGARSHLARVFNY